MNRDSLSNVNPMGDCDGATQSEGRWSLRWHLLTIELTSIIACLTSLEPWWLRSEVSNVIQLCFKANLGEKRWKLCERFRYHTSLNWWLIYESPWYTRRTIACPFVHVAKASLILEYEIEVYLPWLHPWNQHMKMSHSNTLWLGYKYSTFQARIQGGGQGGLGPPPPPKYCSPK